MTLNKLFQVHLDNHFPNMEFIFLLGVIPSITLGTQYYSFIIKYVHQSIFQQLIK